MVEEAKTDDNSIVEMTEAKMAELKIYKGDAIILRGTSVYYPRQKAQNYCCYSIDSKSKGWAAIRQDKNE